jgi:hypothetical protein
MENPLVYTDNNQYYQYCYYYPNYENNLYNSYNSNKNTNDKYSYNNIGKKEWNKICKNEQYIEIIMNNCHLIEKYNSWKFLVQNKSLYKYNIFDYYINRINESILVEMINLDKYSAYEFFFRYMLVLQINEINNMISNKKNGNKFIQEFINIYYSVFSEEQWKYLFYLCCNNFLPRVFFQSDIFFEKIQYIQLSMIDENNDVITIKCNYVHANNLLSEISIFRYKSKDPEQSTTDAPSTDAPSTDASSTDAPSTDAPSTDASSTDASSTDASPNKSNT